MFRQYRTEAKGGVLVYAANSVKCTEMNIESALEFCVVKVAKADLPPLAIATIYRSPNTPLRTVITLLQDFLHMLRNQNVVNIVVTGDFNENQFGNDCLPIMSTFANYGFKQIVSDSTTKYGSLLDLMFVHVPDFNANVMVVPTYYTDHEPVLLSLIPK